MAGRHDAQESAVSVTDGRPADVPSDPFRPVLVEGAGGGPAGLGRRTRVGRRRAPGGRRAPGRRTARGQHPVRTEDDVLAMMSLARHHRQWFAGLATPYLGSEPVEIGSGLGDYATEWCSGVTRITLSDIDPAKVEGMTQRFAGDPRVRVRLLGLPAPGVEGDHSAALAFNVLEHIEDDAAALGDMRRLVRPGGAVVIVVPAFEFAMTELDRLSGHVRRYRAGGVRELMERSGLTVERLEYVNVLGLVGYVLADKLGSHSKVSNHVRGYDNLVVPITKGIERFVRPPFGQSVFAVGRVPL